MNNSYRMQRRGIVLLILSLILALALAACERQLQPEDNEAAPTLTEDEADAPATNSEGTLPGDATEPTVETPDTDGEDTEVEEVEPTAPPSEEEPIEGIPSDDPEVVDEATPEETSESPRPADEATEEPTAEAPADESPDEEEAAAEEAEEEAAAVEEEEAVVEPTATPTPEATPTESPAAESVTQEQTHTVQPGENLYRIGLQYGISWVVLANYNNLPNANAITVGQTLKIPADPNVGGGTPTPTPTPAGETTYVVKPGDTLYRIGRAFNMSWKPIADANNLVNPNRIYVGQELKIPTTTPDAQPQITHTVTRGETLYLISLRYGIPWTTIATANDLAAPNVIYPGQTLVIPGQ